MRASGAAIVALCVAAAGCGTARIPAGPPAVPAAARTGPAATVAGNRAAARAEAARLLPLARVPAGAVRAGHPPRSLPGPGMGRPAATSLVDRFEVWRVPLPFAAARTWLSAHRPPGLHSDGTSSSGNAVTGRTTMAGISYRGPAGPAWQSADLEIAAAPAGPHASFIRVDAVVVWLDPRPVRSGPGAHPVRVTLAGGCPATDRGVTGVTNPGARLTRRLLPAGQPTAGLRCRYDGLNGHPWHLVKATRLTARAARGAASAMTRIPLGHVDGEWMSCPSSDGSATVLVLAYPGHPDVDLWIRLGGCGGVSNGYIVAGGA